MVAETAMSAELTMDRPASMTSDTSANASKFGLAGNQTGGTCMLSCGVLRLDRTIQTSGKAAITASAMINTNSAAM